MEELDEMRLVQSAIAAVSAADVAFCKFLSANDTGETGAHQSGVLIPRAAWRLILDREGVKGEQLDRHFTVDWMDGAVLTDSRGVYYGCRTRNEYRMTRFGRGFPFLRPDRTGDLLVAVRDSSGALRAWVLSTEEAINDFLGAFALSPENTNTLIGAEARPSRSTADAINEYAETLGVAFPSTTELARQTRELDMEVENRDVLGDPDATITRWVKLEYQLFRAVEEAFDGPRVANGFASMDEFLEMANSVLNRRKSRAGRSLEHHLEALFRLAGLEFSAQARTEGNSRPDFLFPSAAAYHDPAHPSENLTFLAVKTTCKDRWRQILNEADRIPEKFLFTLQQGISAAQLDEMARAGVTLVVPAEHRSSFASSHRDAIWSLARFMDMVRNKQPRAGASQ